jgi:hypothetical protein
MKEEQQAVNKRGVNKKRSREKEGQLEANEKRSD